MITHRKDEMHVNIHAFTVCYTSSRCSYYDARTQKLYVFLQRWMYASLWYIPTATCYHHRLLRARCPVSDHSAMTIALLRRTKSDTAKVKTAHLMYWSVYTSRDSKRIYTSILAKTIYWYWSPKSKQMLERCRNRMPMPKTPFQKLPQPHSSCVHRHHTTHLLAPYLRIWESDMEEYA